MDRMTWEHPYPETALDFLGVQIHRLELPHLMDCFRMALDSEGPTHFAYLNPAVSNKAADHPELASILNQADVVYVDGVGIRIGCRLLGEGCSPRTTAGDFLPKVMSICSEKGKTVGFFGGSPGAARELKNRLEQEIPGTKIVFARDGYGELEDTESWKRELAEDPPDLLLVGLGVPKQEEWIDKYRRTFKVRLYWSVGALFEYDQGLLKRCPAWMRTLGLEWVHRLCAEPGRLWKRYLIGNPRFLLRCLCSRWRGRAGIF